MEKCFKDFLKEIAPYIVVVGSFARNAETPFSDIDCFLRSRPLNEIDYEKGSDTYMPEVVGIIKKHGYVVDSVLVGHISVERQLGVPRMVEISSFYRIPHTEPLFYREIYGVNMLCGKDDKEIDYDECYDYAEWDDTLNDMVIRHPIPEL